MWFSLSALNIYINTDVSGLFFQDRIIDVNQDVSYHINIQADILTLNKLFLFYSDNTTDIGEDLNDLNTTDLKYAFNLNQWNLNAETTKTERKYVVENYLIDLFGNERSQALKNIDIFSNENAIDTDILNIFKKRLSQLQRKIIFDGSDSDLEFFQDNSNNTNINHGAFKHNGSINDLSADLLNSVAVDNTHNSITKKMLEIALQNSGSGNNVFKRQFADTNTSNVDYNLPPGWRTFQFAEGDKINFNVYIKQKQEFFPPWSHNQSALTGDSTITSYRINITVSQNPTSPLAIFNNLENLTPSAVNTLLQQNIFEIQNILSRTVISDNDITIDTGIVNNNDNVDNEILITINTDFANVTQNEKDEITNYVKELMLTTYNISNENVLVEFVDGSLKVKVFIIKSMQNDNIYGLISSLNNTQGSNNVACLVNYSTNTNLYTNKDLISSKRFSIHFSKLNKFYNISLLHNTYTTDNIYVLVNGFYNEDIYISEYNNSNPTISNLSPTVTTQAEINSTGNARKYINLNLVNILYFDTAIFVIISKLSAGNGGEAYNQTGDGGS